MRLFVARVNKIARVMCRRMVFIVAVLSGSQQSYSVLGLGLQLQHERTSRKTGLYHLHAGLGEALLQHHSSADVKNLQQAFLRRVVNPQPAVIDVGM